MSVYKKRIIEQPAKGTETSSTGKKDTCLVEYRHAVVSLERDKRTARKNQLLPRPVLNTPTLRPANCGSLLKAAKPELKPRDHLFQTFQAVRFMQTARPLRDEEIQEKTVDLPRKSGWERKKTVVFDMDETLVHCVEDAANGQVSIDVEMPGGQQVQVGVNFRPYAREVLQAANTDYEVIVFTASHQCYADKVLNHLDPDGSLIHHRLYRDHCIVVDGVYVKDLRILQGRALKNIVIVDNAAQSFAYQMHNGVPIASWYDDAQDKELFKLKNYLAVLAKQADVRVLNKQTFRLDSFCEDYLARLAREKENVH